MQAPANPIITIIICTYNRPLLLKKCLESLMAQKCDPGSFEVLVINNFLEDFPEYIYEIPRQTKVNIHIIYESNIGLSYARNRGLKKSTTAWVGYIDDDAEAFPNWISTAIEIIEQNNFHCFGGAYIPLYEGPNPAWLPENFGSKPILRQTRGLISEGYNWGSNVFFDTLALRAIGGFPLQLGMKGLDIRFAEETYVQKILRDNGYKIGFDPMLKVHHLVPVRKMNLRWQIKAAYAQGRDLKSTFPEHYTFKSMFTELLRHVFITPAKSSFLLMTKKGFGIKHFIYKTGTHIARVLGRYRTLFSS